jgi:hypothetical protein
MADEEAPEPVAKVPKTNGQRASSNLRAARKGLQANDWAEDLKAKYLLEEASVLATLELADAIRAGAK